MYKRGLSNKGQVTLFIIFGIFLVIGVLFFFFSYRTNLSFFGIGLSSPTEVISQCVEDAIEASQQDFFDSWSSIQDNKLVYRYNQQTMPFLCYSSEFYYPCVPQNPLFIEAIRINMENKVSRELSRCILKLKEDYEKKGYLFENSNFNLSLIFNELDIAYDSEMNIKISKGEESILISSKEGRVPSSVPKLLRTAETIVNYESLFCEFNHMTWQVVNKDIVIERFRAGDQTKVYTLRSRNFEDEIKFAIRTCVLPAGI